MALILKLAWRNIWRNKRRSILTILAVFFAVFLTASMRGLQLGTYAYNIKTATSVFTGSIQIQKKDFNDNPSLLKSLRLTEELKKDISKISGVKDLSKRIYSYGLVGIKDNTVGAAIFGIQPEEEKKLTTIYKKLNQGKFVSNDRIYDVVIGIHMLKNLEAGIGDTIVILSNTYYGSMGNLKFRICGAVKTGSADFDNMSVFMTYKAAEELLDMQNLACVVPIQVTDYKRIQPIKKEINELLSSEKYKEKNLTALDWSELMPDLQQTIELDNVSGVLFAVLLIIVVAFGILNTVLMSVTERFREFGVMLALGAKQFSLLMIVFFETLFITFMGLILGSAGAFLVNLYIKNNPIDIGAMSPELEDMYKEFNFEPIMASSVEPYIFIETVVVIFIVSLLVFVYPGYKIFKLEPLKGIRYT